MRGPLLRGVALAALTFLSFAWTGSASAQRTLLISSRHTEGTVDPAFTSALRTALRAHGADVVPDEALRGIVEERLSREPVAVGADEVGELAAAVRELEALVATRQRETALRQAEHVRALSEGTVDALAEQRELARTLMSGCLADAWLHLQMDESEAARERLRACREMHPDVAVDTRTTPPIVARLLTQIDAELASRPRRSVQIDTQHEGCDVLLNGRHVGTTPAPIADVPIGRYQVELVCPRVGHRRVHTLVVADEDRWIAIDPRFDDALRSADVIELLHPDVSAEQTNRVEYALRVATAASATEAIVLSPRAGATRADRISLGGGVLASVLMDSPEDATDAVNALVAGRSLDLTGASPQQLDLAPVVGGSSGEPVASPRRAPRPNDPGLEVAGITVGAIGLAALAGGWASYGVWTSYRDERATLGDTRLSRYFVLGQQMEQSQWAGVALGISGAVMIAASIPMWLPEDAIDDASQIPWWSWTLGVAGLAAIGAGAAFAAMPTDLVSFEHCSPAGNMCFVPQSQLFLASMLFETGGALLALPLTHLVRLAVGPAAPSVSASASATSASIGLGGSW